MPSSRKRHTGAPRPWTLCDRDRSPGSRVDALVRPSRGFRLSGIDGQGSPFTVAGAASELQDQSPAHRIPSWLRITDPQNRDTQVMGSDTRQVKRNASHCPRMKRARDTSGQKRNGICDDDSHGGDAIGSDWTRDVGAAPKNFVVISRAFRAFVTLVPLSPGITP